MKINNVMVEGSGVLGNQLEIKSDFHGYQVNIYYINYTLFLKMKINNVMVAGSGVLGSQIVLQSAFHGYQVNIYDINDDVLVKAKERINALIETYTDYFKDEQKAKEAVTRITFHSDIEKSVE